MESIKHTCILGMKINIVDTAEALAAIEGFIGDGKSHIVVTADSFSILLAQRDPEFRDIVNNADLVTPDSTGVLWAARKFGVTIPERASGIDVLARICESGAKVGRRVFLYGAAPGVAEEAAKNLVERYPGIVIAGTQHGFLSDAESSVLVDTIKASKPDVLFVAMGIPRQEKWIAAHLEELGVPVSMGVGGSFDVISGRIKRAPEWMQKRGIEWVYRLFMDYKKFGKVMNLPVFMYKVIMAKKGRGAE